MCPHRYAILTLPLEDFKMAAVVKALLCICFLGMGFSEGTLMDLTHVLDMDHISYPEAFAGDDFRFIYTYGYAGPFQGIPGTFVAFNAFSMVEHIATHIDAPYHFSPTGRHIDEVPLDDLIGPLVKIDITEKAQENPDAVASRADLELWESQYGRIPDGAFILVASGWDQYWGDNDKYVGTPEDHFPGMGEDAIVWLLEERNIRGVGVDSLGCDPGTVDSEKYAAPVHQLLLPGDKVCIENLKNVVNVPTCGAKLFALPIMTKNGTACQARVFAEWDGEVGFQTDCGGTLTNVVSSFNNGGISVTAPFYVLFTGICLLIWNKA